MADFSEWNEYIADNHHRMLLIAAIVRTAQETVNPAKWGGEKPTLEVRFQFGTMNHQHPSTIHRGILVW